MIEYELVRMEDGSEALKRSDISYGGSETMEMVILYQRGREIGGGTVGWWKQPKMTTTKKDLNADELAEALARHVRKRHVVKLTDWIKRKLSSS